MGRNNKKNRRKKAKSREKYVDRPSRTELERLHFLLMDYILFNAPKDFNFAEAMLNHMDTLANRTYEEHEQLHDACIKSLAGVIMGS